MCRLLGVVGDVAVQQRAARAFHRLGAAGQVPHGETPGHLDGWGIVTYPAAGPCHVERSGGSVEAERERYFAAVDALAKDLSRVLVVHLRKATKGTIEPQNAHPFCDREWVLAHNGTVLDLDALGPVRTCGTDSEALLSHWVDAGRPIHEYAPFIDTIAQQCRYSSLTTIVANQTHFLAYRKFSLTPLKPLALEDPAEHLRGYYTLWHWTDGVQHVISSEQLPEVGAEWTLLPEGTPLILEHA